MKNDSPIPIQIDLNLLRDYIHLPTRTIFLEGEVSPAMAVWTAKALHLLEIHPKLPISIYLQSEGGDLSSGLAIYDLIRACKSIVRIIGYGEICSAGVLIFCAGDERYCMKHTEFMIHPPTTHLDPRSAEETVRLAKVYKRSGDHYYRILGQYLGLNMKQMNRKFPRDSWFNASQAKKLGLVDRII